MMEDTGEDVLRQRPNMLVTFFQRLGQVILVNTIVLWDWKLTPKKILDISDDAGQVDPLHDEQMGLHCSPRTRFYGQNSDSSGTT